MGLESGIQTAILHYLALLESQGKLYHFRSNSFGGFVERRNGTKGFINNAKAGMPDIVVCMGGRFIGIEVKSPTGRQQASQKAAQEAIEACGGVYILARSVDDVIAGLSF